MTDSYAKNDATGAPDQPGLGLRRAGPDDAAALAEIGRDTFVETFGDQYPPQDLAVFLDATHSLAAASVTLADPQKAVWLLEDKGEVVGYAVAGPCKLPHPKVREDHGELHQLYLKPDYQGRGIGAWMLREALAWLEKDGPRVLWLGVFSENLGAQGFYAQHGFKPVGQYLFIVGHTRDVEYIMRRGGEDDD